MTVEINDLYNQKLEIDKTAFKTVECHERLKIARGYYAVFLHASSLFLDSEIKSNSLIKYDYPPNATDRTPAYGPHQKIYMSLQRSKIRNLVDLGFLLHKYHTLRKKADYDLHLNITDDDIRSAEAYYTECKERIDFYIANGDHHFTKAKKVINATVGRNGVKTSGLKILK
jgi:uncharacterized protein (UPF0332 family)